MSAIPKEVRPGAGATARLSEHLTSLHYEGLCERLRQVIWSFDNQPDVEELYRW
ncbi:MAG: hypothetical protein ACXWCY_23965 [Burkholderiales bacterium]